MPVLTNGMYLPSNRLLDEIEDEEREGVRFVHFNNKVLCTHCAKIETYHMFDFRFKTVQPIYERFVVCSRCSKRKLRPA